MKRTSLPRRTFRTGAPDPRECARQKRGRPGKVGISLLTGLIYVVCLMALCRAASSLDSLEPVPRPPRLSPHYAGIVIPPNIAPLNFAIEEGCINCHTFLAHRAEPMALHIRHRQSGNPMLLIQSNAVTRVDQTSGYLSWHPSGRLLAFAVNRFALLFHTTGETRDLYDGASDLGIHRLDSNQVVMPPAISRPDRLENWPA